MNSIATNTVQSGIKSGADYLEPSSLALGVTLSGEKLSIEIALAEYFSRLLSNIQSEQSYDHKSLFESPRRDLNCYQQWR